MPNVVSPPSAITLTSLLAPGMAAVRKYWRPFLLLQSAAFLLVVAYYENGRVRLLCDQLSQSKEHAGLVFSAIAAAISGALLPELAKAVVMDDRAITRKRVRDVAFAMAAFAGSGIMIDLQYRGLAWLFGHDTLPATIVKKVLADQFVTTPIYGIPYWVLVYSLRAKRYNLMATFRPISPRWYVTHVLPLLIPGWCFWLPMVTLIYLLPGPVQFCLFCFALAAWNLLMVFVATHEATADSTPAA
jgi:hypothetical protein